MFPRNARIKINGDWHPFIIVLMGLLQKYVETPKQKHALLQQKRNL